MKNSFYQSMIPSVLPSAVIRYVLFSHLCLKFIYSEKAMKFCKISTVDLTGNKAKLQKEGIYFLIHLFVRDILLMKKLEIEETKTI